MERIYDDKGNWWVIEIVNGKETWVMHNYKGRSVRKYGPDGYDVEGYDRRGFDRNGVCKRTGTRYGCNGKDVDGFGKLGFDKEGLNAHGFRKSDHLNDTTNDTLDEDGYNFYGINQNGYLRSGKKDPDVAVLEDFIFSGTISPSDYARKHNLKPDEIREHLKEGLKKAPWLDHDYTEVINKGRVSRVKCVSLDFEKVKTYTDLSEFWEAHPYLTISETYRMLGKKKEVLTALLDVLIDLIHNDPTNIELLIRSFSPEYYDLNGALSWIRWLRKFTDKADRIKTYEIEKHMKGYSAKKLYPGKYTVKGKEHIVTEEDIKRGEEELKAAKRFVCAKTLKEVCFK